MAQSKKKTRPSRRTGRCPATAEARTNRAGQLVALLQTFLNNIPRSSWSWDECAFEILVGLLTLACSGKEGRWESPNTQEPAPWRYKEQMRARRTASERREVKWLGQRSWQMGSAFILRKAKGNGLSRTFW